MSTLLLFVFFFGSLGGILFLIIRHLPEVASLRPEELAHIRHKQLKTTILLARFDRLVFSPLKALIRTLRPWSMAVGKQFHRLFDRLKVLEHYYEKLSLQRERTATNAAVVVETSETLIIAAKELAAKGLFDDAERKYIAAVALDPKSMSAYEGLGELYFEQKNYEAARETYAHIVKLNERSAAAYARLGAIASASGNLEEAEHDYARAAELANDLLTSHIDLGVVHQKMEKYEAALQNFLKAHEVEPKNPRVLDLLLETALVLGKSTLARDTLAALTEANPENQKLEELRERVAALPKDGEIPIKKMRRKKNEGP